MEKESVKKRPREEPPQQPEGGGAEQIATTVRLVLEDLDCPLCFRPLKPPIFQCVVGHVICSSCHGKLANKDNCQTCSIAGGYNRCFAVDRILDSVRVPCSNSAKYGCTAVTRYHDREEHKRSCPHAPCFCPEPGCGGFAGGSTVALQRHLAADHGWPSTEFKLNKRLTLQVQEGTQVLHSDDAGGPLFLVRFTPAPPFGCAATVLCVDPHAAALAEPKFKCHLAFHCHTMGLRRSSDFEISSSNLSDGLPTEDGYSFVVPNASSSSSFAVGIVKILTDKCGSEIQLNKRWRQLKFASSSVC